MIGEVYINYIGIVKLDIRFLFGYYFYIAFKHMEVNEPIDIYTIIKKGKLIPIAFKWKTKRYLIDSINLTYTQKIGVFPIYYFSVSIQETLYKISISLKDNVCTLCEIYTE